MHICSVAFVRMKTKMRMLSRLYRLAAMCLMGLRQSRVTALLVCPSRPTLTRSARRALPFRLAMMNMYNNGGSINDRIIQKQKEKSASKSAPGDIDDPVHHIEHQRAVFDEMSGFFSSDEAIPPDIVPVMRQIAYKILKRSKYQPVRLLDIGCGTGALFPFYLQAANDLNIPLSVTGVDLSPKMVSAAMQKAQRVLKNGNKQGIHSIDILNEEFISMMEQEQDMVGAYDAVVANSCFGNFYDTDALLRAMINSLKVGGTMFITHPLGADFVRQLHEEDPSTVPHLLPSKEALELSLLPFSVIEYEEQDSFGTPIYFASAVKTPYRPLQQVIRLRAKVDSGYGRGGKKLGFPTANLPESLFADALKSVDTGVYFGWAIIEGRDDMSPQKAAVNVGYSPTFEGKENREKIVEAHLILEEEEQLADFYGETMRLALIGFLRPEQKFDSFPDLVEAIGRDVKNARQALSAEPYVSLRSDPFVANPAEGWVGASGGDDRASWEFQDALNGLLQARA